MLKSTAWTHKSLISLVVLQTFFAIAVLANELLAISNRVPGGNFPIEHASSWVKVLLFCSVAILSIPIVYALSAKNRWSVFTMPIKTVGILGALITLFSSLSSYEAASGWCCEVFPIRYLGLPFSYFRGKDLIQILHNYGFLKFIENNLLPYHLLLDFLFWTNAIFVVLGVVALLSRKEAFQLEKKES